MDKPEHGVSLSFTANRGIPPDVLPRPLGGDTRHDADLLVVSYVGPIQLSVIADRLVGVTVGLSPGALRRATVARHPCDD